MKISLISKESELYRRVDEVLYYLWDPIGVSDTPEARDEYDDYIPEVCAFLIKSPPIADLVAYLDKLQTESMERPLSEGKNKQVAEILFLWKELLNK